jgi:hypothetical protein
MNIPVDQVKTNFSADNSLAFAGNPWKLKSGKASYVDYQAINPIQDDNVFHYTLPSRHDGIYFLRL